MAGELTMAEVKARLAEAVEMAGGVTRFAEQHRISVSYVSEALSNGKEPGPRIFNALGLIRVERFIEFRRGSNGGPNV